MNKLKKKNLLESSDYYPAILQMHELMQKEIDEIKDENMKTLYMGIKEIMGGFMIKEEEEATPVREEIPEWKSTKNPPKYNSEVILYHPETEEFGEYMDFGLYEIGNNGKDGRWFLGDHGNAAECDPLLLYWMYRPRKPC
jgi:hypothetical protein